MKNITFNTHLYAFISSLLVLLVISVMMPTQAHAQRVAVDPMLEQVLLLPGETYNHVITVNNLDTKNSIVISPSFTNITSTDISGGIDFDYDSLSSPELLNTQSVTGTDSTVILHDLTTKSTQGRRERNQNKEQEAKELAERYALQNITAWTTTDVENRFILEPHESRSFTVSIQVPQTVAPGTYILGMLLESSARDDATVATSGDTTAQLSQGIVTLLVVQVGGGSQASLHTSSTLSGAPWYEAGQKTFTIELENLGSAYAYPTGKLVFRSLIFPWVKQQYTLQEDIPGFFVFPKQNRSISVQWDSEKTPWWAIGPHALFLELEIPSQTIHHNVVFWFLPKMLMMWSGVVLASIALLILISVYGASFIGRKIKQTWSALLGNILPNQSASYNWAIDLRNTPKRERKTKKKKKSRRRTKAKKTYAKKKEKTSSQARRKIRKPKS